MPGRKTTPTSSKSTSSKSSPKTTEEKPTTFAEAKFKTPPKPTDPESKPPKSKPPETEPAKSQSKPPKPKPDVPKPEVTEPEVTKPSLKENQWVKVLSGEFINQVGVVKEVGETSVTVILQGKRLSYPLAEVTGLEITKSMKTPVGGGGKQLDGFYREFHVFTSESLVGGVEGRAINREKGDIRIERHYHGVSVEEVGKVMIGLVDAVIEEKKLNIPPYQEPKPAVQKSVAEINAEINAREKAEAEARRAAQTFEFEAISGVQAGGLIFTAILSFKKVSQLIDVNLAKVPPEERYQRVPSPRRVKAIASYVIQYPDSYVLPSITCTIEGEYEFKPQAARSSLGTLVIEPGTKLHPIDGGHRLNSIRSIIKQVPKLEEEEICVKFVIDRGLEHRRQLFSDVNKEQVKPPKAISLEYDRRDREANFHRDVIDEIPLFAKYTERTKGSASGKGSNNLFVLTWLHGANKVLRPHYSYEVDRRYCVEWWKAVVANIPVLANYDPQDPRISPQEVRDNLCCTALVFKALGTVGHYVSLRYRDSSSGVGPSGVAEFLKPLSQINWSKENPDWEGMIIETTPAKVGVKRKILTKNTEQLIEYLKKQLIKDS